MPKSKYDIIYRELKDKIINNEYPEGDYLPPENTLVQIYDCSRNTIRRAISHLVMEGYVQPHHGKGVRVIFSSEIHNHKYDFMISGTDGVHSTASKYGYSIKTKVITFTDMVIDDRLSCKTGFPIGTEVYFIQRVLSLDGIAKMVETCLLRKDVVTGLNKEIAGNSLFEYFTKTLGMEITTVKRKITVEHTTPFDEKYLQLNDYNCLAVLTSLCYNENGLQFEYSEARNRPDIFVFNSVMTKSLQPADRTDSL
mgnify:FL=1